MDTREAGATALLSRSRAYAEGLRLRGPLCGSKTLGHSACAWQGSRRGGMPSQVPVNQRPNSGHLPLK